MEGSTAFEIKVSECQSGYFLSLIISQDGMGITNSSLELDYGPVYAYWGKQNSDIRKSLQLNPVSIFMNF